MATTGSLAGRPMKAARNGVISGRVELRRPPVPAGRRPGVADLGMPATPLTAEEQARFNAGPAFPNRA